MMGFADGSTHPTGYQTIPMLTAAVEPADAEDEDDAWRARRPAQEMVCSPDGANGSRECAPDDKLREIRDSRNAAPGLRFAPSGLQPLDLPVVESYF
jgi:hypothetical protein